MGLNFTPEEEAFRAEVRTFLAEKYPKRLADNVRKSMRPKKADHEEWHAILNARGGVVVEPGDQVEEPGLEERSER